MIYRKKQFLCWLLVYCIILGSYSSHCESSPKIHLKQKVHEGQWDIWSPPYFTLHISKWSPHLGLARASSEVLRYYPRCSADCWLLLLRFHFDWGRLGSPCRDHLHHPSSPTLHLITARHCLSSQEIWGTVRILLKHFVGVLCDHSIRLQTSEISNRVYRKHFLFQLILLIVDCY